MNTYNICFTNSPFLKTNRKDPFLEFLLEQDLRISLKINPQEADYLILYPNLLSELYLISKKFRDKILIFITGEAFSPDFNLFDYAFGYDLIDMGDRYMQIFYQEYFYEYNVKNFDLKELINRKNRFCNFIYSNPKAHPNRDKFFYNLNEYKNVDSIGKHLRNVTFSIADRHRTDFFKQSVEAKIPYKFSISFENALFKGYNTEKIISSFLAKTIPIYWGDPDIEKYFNPEAFINVHHYKTFDEVIQRVTELDNNDDKYLSMLSQPMRTEEQELLLQRQKDAFVKQLQYIFKQPYKEAFRKPQGTFIDHYLQGLRFKEANTTMKLVHKIAHNIKYKLWKGNSLKI